MTYLSSLKMQVEMAMQRDGCKCPACKSMLVDPERILAMIAVIEAAEAMRLFTVGMVGSPLKERMDTFDAKLSKLEER